LSNPEQNFKNILVIHFGQLGDVILSLPALQKIREKFPDARLTLLVGKASASLLKDLHVADEVIAVDRVALLRGRKISSIREIFKLVGDVRRRRFDFVIDLHSLSETNILGFLSGARHRLYANRESRSLDFLGNFRPRPEREDKSKHLADFYLAVLAPLGIEPSRNDFRIEPEQAEVDGFLAKYFPNGLDAQRLIGFVIGAGHPSRRWPLDKFAELSHRISALGEFHQLIFLGPEEEGLMAAFSCLELLITNDTGPPHLAAIAGARIVLVIDRSGPLRYLPLTKKIEIVNSAGIKDIPVDEVYQAVIEMLEE
jgi:ADP-heptose:LPS heptosyltransferase